jgi:hypothetical protein
MRKYRFAILVGIIGTIALIFVVPHFAVTAGHEEPATNVSEYVHKKCKVAYRARLTDKIDLEILSPEYVHFDGEPIQKAYQRAIAEIGKYHFLQYAPNKQVKWLERHRKATVRLVLLAAPETQHKAELRFYTPDEFYNVADVHFDIVRVPWDKLQDCSSWLICQVLCGSSRAMWLEMASVHVRLKQVRLRQPGWYDMGVSELISLRCGSPACYDPTRESQCFALFSNPVLRAGLWDFCPGCTHPKEPVKGEELKAAIDEKKAALGAILYLERILGESKFLAVTRELSSKEIWQDEQFYATLSSLAGLDIRKVSQEELDKMASSFQPKP